MIFEVHENVSTGDAVVTYNSTSFVKPKLTIDKLKLCIDADHCALCAQALALISEMFWISPSSKNAWNFPKQTKPHFQYANQLLNSGATLNLKYGQSHGKKKAFLEFNPALVTVTGWMALDVQCAEFYAGGYVDLCDHARVSNIDFACDVPGINIKDFAFIDTRVRSSLYKFAEVGTVYLGSRTGRRQMRIYDKQRHLNQVLKVAHEHALLRIEARLSLTSGTLPQLVSGALAKTLGNPFATVYVIGQQSSNEQVNDGYFSSFVDGLNQGLPAQVVFQSLLPMPPSKLKSFKNKLAAAAPMWWTPSSIWSMAGPALKRVANPFAASQKLDN